MSICLNVLICINTQRRVNLPISKLASGPSMILTFLSMAQIQSGTSNIV